MHNVTILHLLKNKQVYNEYMQYSFERQHWKTKLSFINSILYLKQLETEIKNAAGHDKFRPNNTLTGDKFGYPCYHKPTEKLAQRPQLFPPQTYKHDSL
jgi:hypothetical protein